MITSSIKQVMASIWRYVRSPYAAGAILIALGAGASALLLQQNDIPERLSAPARVSAVAPALSVLPDFALMADVDARKQQFFDFLEAYVYAENARLRRACGLCLV